jgi:hypothetical protein
MLLCNGSGVILMYRNEFDGSFKCSVLFHELGIGEATCESKLHDRKAAANVALGYARDDVKSLSVLCHVREKRVLGR